MCTFIRYTRYTHCRRYSRYTRHAHDMHHNDHEHLQPLRAQPRHHSARLRLQRVAKTYEAHQPQRARRLTSASGGSAKREADDRETVGLIARQLRLRRRVERDIVRQHPAAVAQQHLPLRGRPRVGTCVMNRTDATMNGGRHERGFGSDSSSGSDSVTIRGTFRPSTSHSRPWPATAENTVGSDVLRPSCCAWPQMARPIGCSCNVRNVRNGRHGRHGRHVRSTRCR